MKMKINYIILAILSLGMFGCEKFLEEEQVATQTADYFNSESGVEDLIKACYGQVRYKSSFEHLYALWNYGVDEYTQSDQLFWRHFNEYSSELNPESGEFDGLWTENYIAINRCNEAIERIPLVEGVAFFADEANRAARMAEVRFLRGYFYFQLIQQFGHLPQPPYRAIPLSLEPVRSERLFWERDPAEDVYEAIIADFTFAAENLPEIQPDYGRITANAARHYAAKAYLTRASEVNQDWNTNVASDLEMAAQFADDAITSGANSLLPDYKDIWDPANQQNAEVLFSAQFNTELTLLSGHQNRSHLFFLNQYDNEPGMTRGLGEGTIMYGRPYRRLMPTDYTYDVSDRLNDSRQRKSFLSVFISNNTTTIPPWTELEFATNFVGHGLTVVGEDTMVVRAPGDTLRGGDPKFAVGDTALVFLVNDENTNLTDKEIVRRGYTTYARYYWLTDAAETPVTLVKEVDDVPAGAPFYGFRPGKAPSLHKYVDEERSGHNDERGTRDVIYARLGETYLIAAEAYGRAGDYTTAAERLTTLRERAGYAAGEAKPVAWFSEDGGSAVNATAETKTAMGIDAGYWDSDEPLENYPPDVASREERFVHFMLNERTRELLGEFHRWEDLVRTETLVSRTLLFNEATAALGALQDFHKRRPIPLIHLQTIHNSEGKPLTAAEMAAMQNPGY